MWVRWVNAIYVKGENWWGYQPKADSGWYWRKICAVKEQLKQYYDESSFAQLPKYSVKKVYQQMVVHHQKLPWCHAVWCRAAVPKHRVICWVMVHGRLQTRSRLQKLGICDTSMCLICDSHEETHPHLFFECCYSKACLVEIKKWLGIPGHIVHYMGLIRWIQWKSKGSNFQKKVLYTAVNAVVYAIWKVRNDALWNNKVPTVLHTFNFVKQSVIDRIQCIGMPDSDTVQQWWQEKIV
ncbi:uncharacterized protein [Spinacia oleracea]|uniref:Reverse transcriptase zinc-binding domain-containing protein n=1 Tax=Spinacia oleracea TaxID=3562 RepID=A0A9R0IQ19_SPIOL|nr:uncharacterized protein LOC110792003 [Spinacia oleracea]